MCSAEKPSEAERDSYGRIGLIFDGVAQCLLKGTGRLSCGIGSGIGDLGGGIRYFICDACGLLFSISHSAVEISGRGLRHVACSARIGVVWCQRANMSESSLPGTFACAGASAAGSQIADAIGPILNEIVDRFGRGQRVAVDEALSFGNEAINVGARVGNDALERIATQAKNRPMATLAVAIGVGLLIGFAVRRS